MDTPKRRPVLYKGEAYSKATSKKNRMVPKEPRQQYDEARQKLISDINTLRSQIFETSENYKLPLENIFALRVDPDFAAKSYYPKSVFTSGGDSELDEVGSRLWKPKLNQQLDIKENDAANKDEEEVGFEKIFYIRTTLAGLDRFFNKLNTEGIPQQAFQTDVRKLRGIDLVSSDERIAGFTETWNGGCVEITLHPFDRDRDQSFEHFKKFASSIGIKPNSIKMKQYDSEGLMFIILNAPKEAVKEFGKYNPLRSIYPTGIRDIAGLARATTSMGAPIAPAFVNIPTSIVGVIDGGYIPGNPALDPYVEVVESTTEPVHLEFAEHGTLSTAAVLYGALNGFENANTLPVPQVRVRNFRVISQLTKDPGLFDVIDRIEEIVPNNPDIKVYNVSLGPKGQISDTDVQRFTYSLDILSQKYKVLFCVAVGNDGRLAGYNRIQSPSDIVNGLGVAAFTENRGVISRAPYSCIGPGREGNKLKPDISAFAGCDRNPIQLLGPIANVRYSTSGTSFSSPITSARVASLIGRSARALNELTARGVIIHQAKNPNSIKHCTELGFGLLPDNLDEMMNCEKTSFTLVFEGEVERGKYREFEIPWLSSVNSGKVYLKWTVAVQTKVDSSSPEDYTSSSVEMYFYPNLNKHNYTFDGRTKKLHQVNDAPEIEGLLVAGWKKSVFPATDSAPKQFLPEGELRKELKWDTIDARTVPKLAKSIEFPSFQVHAIGRGSRTSFSKIKFAIVLTIDVPSFENFYDEIVDRYHALLPIELELDNELNVENIA